MKLTSVRISSRRNPANCTFASATTSPTLDDPALPDSTRAAAAAPVEIVHSTALIVTLENSEPPPAFSKLLPIVADEPTNEACTLTNDPGPSMYKPQADVIVVLVALKKKFETEPASISTSVLEETSTDPTTTMTTLSTLAGEPKLPRLAAARLLFA